ncbi:MAG: acyl-CoA dehydrogenase family protein [Bacteriovoracaceae bacterium]
MSYSEDQSWKWLIEKGIDWDKIIPLYYPSFPTEDGIESKEELIQFFHELLSSTSDWAEGPLKERASLLDEHGAGEVKDGKTYPNEHLKAFYKDCAELGVFGLPFPRNCGGLHAPASLSLVIMGQIAKYCVASSTQFAFFASIGDMVYRFLDEEEAKETLPKIASGEISGSMCLTEPGSGSDLSKIKTIASPTEEGHYLLNGSKLFITNAGGGLQFVLAKVKGAPDTLEGLSLFYVKQDDPLKEGLNYHVVKDEEKMGMHGSFTCEVLYENTVGRLVGKEGEGFKIMLHLMNEARIAVGMQGLGGIEGSLALASQYASERSQFDRNLKDLPLFKRNFDDLQFEFEGIKALLVDTISTYDQFQVYDLKKTKTDDLSEEEKQEYKRVKAIVRKRTPLVKFYACEQFTNMSKICLQLFGGYGFIKEYPIERLHRDSFGPLLYEGTSQIQALMTLKDLVKEILTTPKSFFDNIIEHTLSGNPLTSALSSQSKEEKHFHKLSSQYYKNVLLLLFGELKPDWNLIHKSEQWQRPEAIDGLMQHAETIAWARSYLETLDVLKNHAEIDEARSEYYWNYVKVVEPRLMSIFHDWKLRR